MRNSNTQDNADLVFALGNPGDEPMVGDFNADGQADIGVARNKTAFIC